MSYYTQRASLAYRSDFHDVHRAGTVSCVLLLGGPLCTLRSTRGRSTWLVRQRFASEPTSAVRHSKLCTTLAGAVSGELRVRVGVRGCASSAPQRHESAQPTHRQNGRSWPIYDALRGTDDDPDGGERKGRRLTASWQYHEAVKHVDSNSSDSS